MKAFNNLFKNKSKKQNKEKVGFNWIPLTSTSQMKVIKEESKSAPVFIFKHSTRCGISRIVLTRFENLFLKKLQDFKVYYLDLLKYREVSDQIVNEFQVNHQSPQLLVINNETSVNDTSHYDILSTDIASFT